MKISLKSGLLLKWTGHLLLFLSLFSNIADHSFHLLAHHDPLGSASAEFAAYNNASPKTHSEGCSVCHFLGYQTFLHPVTLAFRFSSESETSFCSYTRQFPDQFLNFSFTPRGPPRV